jgi:phage-related minor tail protein
MSRRDDPVAASLDEAGQSLARFADGPAREAADAVAEAFEKAGRRMAGSLAEAARSGEISVKGLASAILRDLSGLAIERFVTQPLDGLVSRLAAALPGAAGLSGARAAGGPVNAGGAYLVGERGPEVFIPRAGGSVEPLGAARPVAITINLPAGGDLDGARKSAAQVAAALARAVQHGSGLL